MSKRKLLIILTIISAIFYGIIFFILSTNYSNLRLNYEKEEKAYVNLIDQEIRGILKGDEDISASFDDLKEIYPLELMVSKNDEVIYQTISFAVDQDREEAINKGAVASEGAGPMEGKDGQYYVWYVIYHMPTPDALENLLGFQNIYLGAAFLIILILIVGIQYLSVRPLYRLKDSMDKLSKYEFESIETTDADSLNKQVGEISSKLSQTFKEVSKKYTKLEVELQEEKERLSNTLQISKALVHDLKTPLHQTLLENEHTIYKTSGRSGKGSSGYCRL